MIYAVTRTYALVKRLGARGAFVYIFRERFPGGLSFIFGHHFYSTPYPLYSPNSRFPLLCRPRTSDRRCFAGIFLNDEYSARYPSTPKFIIDCGANVGYASAFFLTRFPFAHVLAIEPDDRNCEILRQNLAPYGDRVTILQSAVWSHRVGLVVQYGGGQRNEWGSEVRPCHADETASIQATDIGSLLENSGFERIDILKMDIERAEAIVFSENYEHWIDKVDTIVIELHNEHCREVFMNALSSYEFEFHPSGKETTVAKRVWPAETPL
jgi:FkbM family methyltransferase